MQLDLERISMDQLSIIYFHFKGARRQFLKARGGAKIEITTLVNYIIWGS